MANEARCEEIAILTRTTMFHIPENGILHSHRREIPKSYIVLMGSALQRRRNMLPVRYELGFYIPKEYI
jgi:hypothetical protein